MAKTRVASYSDKEHRAALTCGKQTKSAPTAVMRATFRSESNSLVLDLQNEVCVLLPIDHIVELSGHSPEELAAVEISPLRDGLLWRSIDVAISVPGLLTAFLGSAVRSQLGTIGGARSTTAKASAARKNGAKGGRPTIKSKAS